MARAARRWAMTVAFATVCLAVPVASFTSDPAYAEEITGGCTGTVNNADATLLTSDDPVVVHDGEQLTVAGNIPAQFAPANPVSNTTVKIWIVDGVFGITSGAHESAGATYTATIDVDDYVNVGVGLYRIDVVNTGPEWRCEYTAYIELDGDALSKPAGLVALAAIIIGAIGVVYTKGRKPKEAGWIDRELGTAEQIEREEAWQNAGHQYPDAVSFEERGTHGWMPATQLRGNERPVWSGKVRLHGHAVAAFFWGLLLGLGIGVLGWQDARWTLNIGSIVILPLVVAAAAAAFAWFGWGYRVRDVAVLPADTPVSEPVEPAPMLDPLVSDDVTAERPTPSDETRS
jgi:hypothetical protein